MALIDSILVFIVGLLIGGLGIYAGGRLVTGAKDYGYAVGTAFIGALLWAVFSFFFGSIPVIGPLITLIVWLWVIKARYPGGWLNAAMIAAVSWITVIAVLSIMAGLGIGSFEAIGVPT